MKKCPFCFEDIQDDAIKCRYCNEWLDKRNTVNGLFTKAKGAISQQISDYKSRTTGYLDLPTAERPLKIDNITLFPDKVGWNNQIYYFKNLQNIFFNSKTNISSPQVTKSLSFSLFFKSNDGLIKKTIFKDGEENTILGKRISDKAREQINLMYKFVAEVSFDQRLEMYINELSTYGYFNYLNGIKIYQNGDIYLLDEYKDNLIDAKRTGRFEFGPSNESQIYIYKDSGAFGISYGRFLEFNSTVVNFPFYLDNDIMLLFLGELVINGAELKPSRMAYYYHKKL